MAGVGMDGLERQIKQLQRELGGKDVELSNVRQELHKHKEVVKNLQRDKEEESFKIERLTDRALKAESALETRVAETGKLQLQVDNMRRTMHEAESSRSKGKNAGDQARIQELQEQLRAKEEQVEDFERRYEVAFSSKQSLPTSKSTFFPSSPTSASGSRRRSTSLSSANQVQSLERELQELSKASSRTEDVLVKLSNAERERDRAVNEKMRIEKQSKRDVETLKGQLEDQGYELAHYKGGGEGNPELNKLRTEIKAVSAERNTLRLRVDDLQQQIDSLASQAGRIEQLEEELSSLRAATTSTAALPTEGMSALKAKIACLEAELATAHDAPTPALNNNTAAKQNLKLQRDVKSLKLQIDALQTELADRDDELLQARSGVPLPGSPVLTARQISDADPKKVADLEDQLSELEAQLAAARTTLASNTTGKADMQEKVSAVETELASTKEQLISGQEELVILRETVSGLEFDIAELKSLVGAKEAQILALVAQEKDALDTAADRSASIQRLQEELATVLDASSAAQTAWATQRAEDQATAKTSEEQQAALAKLQAELEETRSKLTETAASLARTEAQIQEAESRHGVTKGSRAELEEKIEQLQASLDERPSLEERAEKEEEMLRLDRELAGLRQQNDAAVTEHQAEMKAAADQLEKHQAAHEAEVNSLQSRIGELQTRIGELESAVKVAVEIKATTEQKNVGMLHSKIAQLRLERDELRQNLSFAQTEGRFALKAVEADRSTAFAKLEAIQADLDGQKSSLELAQVEKVNLEVRVKDLVAARDQAVEEQARLEQAHEHSQRETGVQLIELVNNVALRGSELVEAQRQLREKTSTIAELERRVDQLQTQRDGEEVEAKDLVGVLETPAQIQAEPREIRTRMRSAQSVSDRHSRRRSEVLSVENMFSLQEQVSELKARVERRDATIRVLQDDLKRLNFNRQVLHDDFEEMRANIDTLTTERDTLSRQIEELQVTQSHQSGQMEEANATIVSLVMGVAVQGRLHASTSRAYQQTARRLLSARSTACALRNTIDELSQSQEESKAIFARVTSVESELQTARSAVAAAHSQLDVLRSAKQAVDADLKDHAEQLSLALQVGKDAETLKARLIELQDTAAIMRERAEVAEDQLGALMTKAAATEKVKQDTEELEKAFKESGEKVVELQGEMEKLLAQSKESEATHATILAKVELALDEAKNEAAGQLARLQGDLEETDGRAEQSQQELDSARSELAQLGQRLQSISEEAAKKTEADRAASEEQLTALRQTLAQTEQRVQQLTADLVAAGAQRDEDNKTLEESAQKIEQLSKEAAVVAELRGELEGKEKELRKGGNLLKFAEAEQKRLATQLKQMQEQLSVSDKEKHSAVTLAKKAEMELSVLEVESAKLKEELAAGSGSTASAEMEERLKELEESLRRKTYEVDEADDRVTEMYKENDKLKKRSAKLQRQLDARVKEAEKLQGDVAAMKQDSELAANTQANRNIAAGVSGDLPSTASLSARKVAPVSMSGDFGSKAAEGSSERVSGRPNVFDATAPIVSLNTSQATSVKRPRPAEEVKATVRHMQHSESISITQSTPSSDSRRKLAFAPKEVNRENLPVAMATGATDGLVKSKSSPNLDWAKPKRENIFARPEGRPSVFRQASTERSL